MKSPERPESMRSSRMGQVTSEFTEVAAAVVTMGVTKQHRLIQLHKAQFTHARYMLGVKEATVMGKCFSRKLCAFLKFRCLRINDAVLLHLAKRFKILNRFTQIQSSLIEC